MTVFIYALADPSTGEVRYVGQSVNPPLRLRQHLWGDHTNPYKERWLAQLARAGREPALLILEEATQATWEARERAWIAFYRAEGARLTNLTEGGEGPGELTPEARERHREAMRGNQNSLGHRHSDEAKEKMRAAAQARSYPTGRPVSEDTRAKIGAAHRGKKRSAADLAAQRARQKGRPVLTAEQQAAHAERLRGKPKAPEVIAKIRASSQARFTDEERARVSQRAREREARKRAARFNEPLSYS